MDDILHELMGEADSSYLVDCADRRANFTVAGWFVFPKGSLSPHINIEQPA